MRPNFSRSRKVISAAILTSCISASLGHEVASAEEPREIVRTEFGSEYSDGSSTIIGDSALFTPGNGSILLKIDSGRPVGRAVRTLQTRYGYVITYEDPQYTDEDDLQNVSASVVRNYSNYAPGTAPKVIVPKGSQLTLHLPASLNIGTQDLNAILQQLVRAQATGPRGGHFRVEQTGEVFHVIPTEVRDRNGNWSPHASILGTPISLPEQDRGEEELYQQIADALKAARHIGIRVLINGGWVIGRPAPELRTTMGATQEPARTVLSRALQLHPVRRTWALLHAPEDGSNVFMLNVWDFPAEPRSTQIPASLTSEVLQIAGSDYLLVGVNRITGGPATDAEHADAIAKASQYCRAHRQRMVLLPLEKHKSPIIPAAVFNCARDESLKGLPLDPREGPAGTVVPNQR
jgi:hypothetical protein